MSLYNDASLVMIPSAYKDGKLYSIKPTDGSGDFTFSRGSNLAATRVDENGLIEKGRENLLLQSNQFDTSWNLSSASLASGQSGYDGTNDAWLFTTTIAGATLTQSITASGVVVFSMYAKKGTVNGIRLRIDAATDADAYFNLFNGSVHSFTGSAIDASMISLGSGWYRCQISANISSPVKVAVYTTDGTTAYENGNIYIQDAQLEAGLVATDYIETTTTTAQAGILEDMPRLDYSGGASCPSLLLEPSRTNLIGQSEYFGAWSTDGVSLDVNNITSLEGLQNAYKITDDTSTGYHKISKSSIFTADGTMRTWSVFVKKGTARYCVLSHAAVFSSSVNSLIFDMESGVYTSQGTTAYFDIVHDPIDMGNGWWRIGFSSDLNSSSYVNFSIGISQGPTWSGNVSYTGDGSLDFYVYGAQVEAGSYPTSYIPCYGAATTRSSENMLDLTLNYGNTFSALFDLSGLGGSTSNNFIIRLGSTNSIYLSVRNSDKKLIFYSPAAFTGYFATAATQKIAISCDGTNWIWSSDGASGSLTATGSCNAEYITIRTDGGVGGGLPSALVNQIALFDTALTADELNALTTL